MGGGKGIGAFSGTQGSNQRERLLLSVTNRKLRNAIDQLYRPGAKIGSGGLADAIRHEIVTGELVGGRSHIEKGRQRIKNLENIIARESLNAKDSMIAKMLLQELREALKEK